MYKIGSCYEKCKEKNGGEKCRSDCDIDNVKAPIGPSSPPPPQLLNPIKKYHIKNTNSGIISTIDEFNLKSIDNERQDQTKLLVCDKKDKNSCIDSDWKTLSEITI